MAGQRHFPPLREILIEKSHLQTRTRTATAIVTRMHEITIHIAATSATDLIKFIICVRYCTDDVLFSRRGRMGKIHSPRHTLPPNTTCTYHFHGQPRDLVWLSFTSYNLQILQHASTVHDNSSTLDRVSVE